MPLLQALGPTVKAMAGSHHDPSETFHEHYAPLTTSKAPDTTTVSGSFDSGNLLHLPDHFTLHNRALHIDTTSPPTSYRSIATRVLALHATVTDSQRTSLEPSLSDNTTVNVLRERLAASTCTSSQREVLATLLDFANQMLLRGDSETYAFARGFARSEIFEGAVTGVIRRLDAEDANGNDLRGGACRRANRARGVDDMEAGEGDVEDERHLSRRTTADSVVGPARDDAPANSGLAWPIHVLTCPHCGPAAAFTTLTGLSRHVRLLHSTSQCMRPDSTAVMPCNTYMAGEYYLAMHQARAHGWRVSYLRCVDCGRLCENVAGLAQHFGECSGAVGVGGAKEGMAGSGHAAGDGAQAAGGGEKGGVKDVKKGGKEQGDAGPTMDADEVGRKTAEVRAWQSKLKALVLERGLESDEEEHSRTETRRGREWYPNDIVDFWESEGMYGGTASCE